MRVGVVWQQALFLSLMLIKLREKLRLVVAKQIDRAISVVYRLIGTTEWRLHRHDFVRNNQLRTNVAKVQANVCSEGRSS
jgi:hypothetical protein